MIERHGFPEHLRPRWDAKQRHVPSPLAGSEILNIPTGAAMTFCSGVQEPSSCAVSFFFRFLGWCVRDDRHLGALKARSTNSRRVTPLLLELLYLRPFELALPIHGPPRCRRFTFASAHALTSARVHASAQDTGKNSTSSTWTATWAAKASTSSTGRPRKQTAYYLNPVHIRVPSDQTSSPLQMENVTLLRLT